MSLEKVIKIAAKLYEVRSVARRFFNDDYQKRLEPYIHIIKQTMKANDIDAMKALLLVSETNMFKDNEIAPMLFIAAAVEIEEPSE